MDNQNRLFQGQDSREQASWDEDQRVPGRDRGEYGNRLLNLREAPILARQLEGGEREGREQSWPAYLHKFPMLMRGISKLEAKRSGLDDVVAEVAQGGCNKRKAELI